MKFAEFIGRIIGLFMVTGLMAVIPWVYYAIPYGKAFWTIFFVSCCVNRLIYMFKKGDK